MAPRKQRLTREESKARTRSELLRAASRLFLRKGYVATSLSDIAEEAALTKGAVYSNFDSKEDLFLALLQEYSNPVEKWAIQAQGEQQTAPSDLSTATGDTPEERAENWGRAIANSGLKRDHVALFFEMNAAALRSNRAREWVADHNAAFFEQIGEDLKQVLDAPDADAATLGFMAQSIFVGIAMHSAYDNAKPDPEFYARAYRLLAQFAKDSAPVK